MILIEGRGSLSRPSLACFIASEMVESNSIRIFTIISVIVVVDGILVYTLSRLRKDSKDSKISIKAS